ncbi:MAG: 2-succinyl-5-enolpyruvyl-6-hydroxy-3-cyclohexene-1-carboxylic-acid synthase [Cyanobacteria bacterium J06581_3]
MSLDFRNTNSLWASVAVETLARLGLQTAVLCPGSRSTPLTFAFAAHPDIESLPILDERSAAFFALGCAKRQRRPVAIVCTSGTAGANFYPAVIEAYESGVSLMIFTADRPPELRDCASGQTIDQQKLYGSFTRHYSEMAVPTAEVHMLAYVRQTLVYGWRCAIAPSAGPVHYNCPFRDPLPPIPDAYTETSTEAIRTTFEVERFFADVTPPSVVVRSQPLPIVTWKGVTRGLIIAGPASPDYPQGYCQAVSELSQQLGWPVLAEGLSPLRNYQCLNSSLISTYDIILRHPGLAEPFIPEQVIQLGPLPISKVLRQWLQAHQPQRWIVGSSGNLDPLHGPTQALETTFEQILTELKLENSATQSSFNNQYRQRWLTAEATVRQNLDNQLATETNLLESKVVWLLSQHLPDDTPLFVANSMPVRDIEYFWPLGDRKIQPFFSRGANGIDGTLSTAMGIAHHNLPAVLLTGDLAFLHDTNGLLNAAQLAGHLTIVVINNNGGGIFEMLPIAQFDTAPEDYFEKYFATPQSVELPSLCKAYGIEHRLIADIQEFVNCVKVLPAKGMRVLEVTCDRKQSAKQRKTLLNTH